MGFRLPSVLLAGLLLCTGLTVVATPAHAADSGFVGPSYSGSTAPTAEKPQSKLWHHDGSWWAGMFDAGSHNFTIHRLDWATQTWTNTGVVIDERSQSKMDVLWSGTKLYVASAGPSGSVGDSARLYRFSYNSTTRQYSLDPGFPTTPVTGGMEAIVLTQDTSGLLWLTYTRNNKVWVTHTLASDESWTAPYVLPVAGADNLSTDDISAVVDFDGRIGVMWGNQNEDAYYFAIHVDGDPDTSWTREVAYSRPEGADDHINLKSIQGDPDGRVFAIVKTSLDAADDPLNVVLVRKANGVWDTDNVFGTKADNETRAIIVVDSENDQVYGFAAAPCCSGGIIYMKKVSIQALLNGNPFSGGPGTPFISSAGNPKINNPTSTKQSVTGATGLVVLAGDDSTRRYLHNKVDIGPPDTTPPNTTIVSGPSGTTSADTATFGFSADEPGSTFECRLDAGTWSGCASPETYTGLANGPHTFEVRATDQAGNTDPSPASRSWTIQAPLDTSIDAGPSGTVPQTSATFEFSANTAGATFECRLDAGSWQACTSPKDYTGLADGQHTFEVRATAGAETDPSPASRTWTVDSSLPLLLNPVEDATVRQANPATNYGSVPTLEADNSPAEQALVKFDLAGIPAGVSVTGATLRLYATNGSGNGPEVHRTDDSWSEGTVTWNNKPASLGGTVADVGSTPVDAWVDYNVTAAVTGNDTYSFGLVPDSSDGVVYSSREAPNPPELLITTGITDTTPPETTVDSGPTGTVSVDNATFGFSADEPGSTFECRLDAGTWSGCASPETYTGLANGPHTFEVRATDQAGNTDPSPASRTWTIQLPLETTIDAGPSGTVPQTSATFEFSANTAGATFECRLDAGSWQACTSPKDYAGLADGQHTFEVRATAGAETDPSPASRTWTVDSTLPTVFVPDADATVRQANPSTNYGSTPRLEADTSPLERAYLKFTVTGVSPGTVQSATLRLYATNGSGNGPEVQATENSWSEGTVTWNNKPASLGGAVADVGSTPVDAWVDYNVTAAVTGNGTYSFGLVPQSSDGVVYSSRDGASAPQLEIVTGGPDTTPPQTTITSGPTGTVGSTSATFGFSADEGGATFECRLDAGTWSGCTGPKTYTGLADGPHTFEVRATDVAGNTDPSPASRNWEVDTTQPATTTFVATADSTVNEDSPAANSGSLTTLAADASPRRRTLVAFEPASLTGTVLSATLRLYVTNGTWNGPTVHEVTSAWDEATVTWDSQPSAAGASLADLQSVDAGAWVEIDVTSAVTGPAPVDLILIPESSDGMFMNSREAPSNRPQLVVTTQ